MISIDKRTRCRELALRRSGEIDLSSSAAKHEAKALGVIIKNQNVLHSPAPSRTCRWQLHRLLNDKESFRPRAKPTTKRKKAKRIGRTIFGRQSKERRVECSGPVMRAPFFHSLRYGKPSHHRHGASVRSFSCYLRKHLYYLIRGRSVVRRRRRTR